MSPCSSSHFSDQHSPTKLILEAANIKLTNSPPIPSPAKTVVGGHTPKEPAVALRCAQNAPKRDIILKIVSQKSPNAFTAQVIIKPSANPVREPFKKKKSMLSRSITDFPTKKLWRDM